MKIIELANKAKLLGIINNAAMRGNSSVYSYHYEEMQERLNLIIAEDGNHIENAQAALAHLYETNPAAVELELEKTLLSLAA